MNEESTQHFALPRHPVSATEPKPPTICAPSVVQSSSTPSPLLHASRAVAFLVADSLATFFALLLFFFLSFFLSSFHLVHPLRRFLLPTVLGTPSSYSFVRSRLINAVAHRAAHSPPLLFLIFSFSSPPPPSRPSETPDFRDWCLIGRLQNHKVATEFQITLSAARACLTRASFLASILS